MVVEVDLNKPVDSVSNILCNVNTLADIPVWLRQVVFSGEINFCGARLKPIRIL